MGYLLKEALKTLCGVNHWSYAIFWKIACQNPKLLIWEECYYEPVIYTDDGHGAQATNKVHLLVTKMMKDNYINLLGEGLVGRAAFTRNHHWIIQDNKTLGVHPSKVSNEVYTQFLAGIQTIAIVPVHPHGVVQLGSSSTIMENMGFVNDVKKLISQLGCVPGALLSENYMKNENPMNTSPNLKEPISDGNSVSVHSAEKSKVTDHALFIPESCNQQGQGHLPQASEHSGHNSLAFSMHLGDNRVANANYGPLRLMEQHILSDAFLGDHVNDTLMSDITREPNNVVCDQLAVPCSFPNARFSHSGVCKTALTSNSTRGGKMDGLGELCSGSKQFVWVDWK